MIFIYRSSPQKCFPLFLWSFCWVSLILNSECHFTFNVRKSEQLDSILGQTPSLKSNICTALSLLSTVRQKGIMLHCSTHIHIYCKNHYSLYFVEKGRNSLFHKQKLSFTVSNPELAKAGTQPGYKNLFFQ